jgi:hypothetical protein
MMLLLRMGRTKDGEVATGVVVLRRPPPCVWECGKKLILSLSFHAHNDKDQHCDRWTHTHITVWRGGEVPEGVCVPVLRVEQ